MTFVTFRRKNKTVEHCFTSMCCTPNTWLRGVTPLNAYTLTQTCTHTHSLVQPCLVIIPGKISFYTETPGGHKLSPHRPTALHTPPSLSLFSLGSLAAWLAILSQLRIHTDWGCVRQNTHIQTQDHVYIDMEQSPGAVQHTSPSSLSFESITCFFIFLTFDCWASRWGRKSAFKDYLQPFCRTGSCLHICVW